MAITERTVDLTEEKDIVTGLIVSDDFCQKFFSNQIQLKNYLLNDYCKRVVQWIDGYFKEYGKCPGKHIEDIFKTNSKSLSEEEADLIKETLVGLSKRWGPNREPEEFNAEYMWNMASNYFKEKIHDHFYHEEKAFREKKSHPKADEIYQKMLQEFEKFNASTTNHSIVSITTKELLMKPLPRAEWVWEDTLAKGGVGMVIGKPKVGKSVFLLNLAACIAEGKYFLDKSTEKCIVGYLGLQESERRIRQRIEAMNFKGNIHWHFGPLPSGSPPEKQVESFILDKKLGFLAVDLLQFLIPSVKDGNSYAQVTGALAPFGPIAEKTNCAMFITHHANKLVKSDPTDNALGSSAYSGSMDFLASYRIDRSTGKRILSIGEGRDNRGRPDFVIDLDEKTWRISSSGDLELARHCEMWSRIEPILKNCPGMTFDELRGELACSRNDLLYHLNRALKEGRILREGLGGQVAPYKFSLRKITRLGLNR